MLSEFREFFQNMENNAIIEICTEFLTNFLEN